MTEHLTTEIAMIGAGVVGMTIALRLAQEGRAVVLLDPIIRCGRTFPRSGASGRRPRTAGDGARLSCGIGHARTAVKRPACPTTRGFYLCPMDGRLRAAGTVELGGLTAPPSLHRLERLVEGARAVLPDLGAPSRDWMGFRPSMPDSLPVIGPSRGGAEVIHAFGHGHIGLTLAPITGQLVSDILAGRAPQVDLAACLTTRFR